MNIIVDNLPDALEVSGRYYPIRSDFRTGILAELLISDSDLTSEEKIEGLLELVYENIPDDIEAAVQALIDYYLCGKRQKKREKEDGEQPREGIEAKIYDFEEDAPYIFADFMREYGINLNSADLHWWEFSALFQGLSDDSRIKTIMGYRAARPADIKNAAERSRVAKLKAFYALPDNRSEESKIAAAGALFGGMI